VSPLAPLKPFSFFSVEIARGTRVHRAGHIMSDSYIIEVSSEAAGIVVRDKSGFRFFAATHRFNPLDGRVFRSAREAERAATRVLAERSNPQPAT
jgi:hypothetical protein